MGVAVSKDGRPLYFMVEQDIKEKIASGVYKEGDLLPTEKAMCEQYDVSRVTVRRAIDELIEEGVLVRSFGKTAAVGTSSIPRNLNRLNGLFEELESQGVKCSSYVLSHKIVQADEALAKKMECPEKEELLRLERLRYADGVPLCYQSIYLPNRFCRQVDVQALANHSLYHMLENRCGVHLSYARQSICAALSSYRIAALLELEEQTPMLKVIRNAYTDQEECVEYSESYYVSKRYSLTMILRR